MKRIPQTKWEWLGYPAHFICAERCRFRMATAVGDFIISTVGDLRLKPEDDKPEPLGAWENSFYETYVFKRGELCGCGCGEPRIAGGCEIDGSRWATAPEAREGHMEFCKKYSKVLTLIGDEHG